MNAKAQPLPRLAHELVEHVLVLAFMADWRTKRPEVYTRVKPGLTVLQKVVQRHSYKLQLLRQIEGFPFASALRAGNLQLARAYARYCKRSDLNFTSADVIPSFSAGRVKLLDWLLHKSKLPVHFGSLELEATIASGQMVVLRWWHVSGLEINITCQILDRIAITSRTSVLQWLLDAGHWFDVDEVEYLALQRHSSTILDWCRANRGAVAKLGSPAAVAEMIERACREGDIGKLEHCLRRWPARVKNNVRWSSCIRGAVKHNQTASLDWIAKVVPFDRPAWAMDRFKNEPPLFDSASEENAVQSLEWLKRNLPPAILTYTEAAIDVCLPHQREEQIIARLEWWRTSGLPLKYTAAAMDDATANGSDRVLWWWRRSGLELKYTGAGIPQAVERMYPPVTEFWRDAGLPNWADLKHLMVQTGEAEFDELLCSAVRALISKPIEKEE
ncbi:hypothetical protein H9P43_002577 [Blastocladiella emersonii ATCC 22665]|nr:hypothetical protein H9P43_002577 [Blastocladiella emersonii ATCC 22665]